MLPGLFRHPKKSVYGTFRSNHVGIPRAKAGNNNYAGARVRAHVFLCMLAYYVEWHMRQRLKPLLFDDEEPDVAEAARPSVVAPGEVSPSAQDKARRKRTASGERVHSFRTLLDDLATVANNRVVAPLADAKPFDLITRPTALQRKASKLLGVRLERTQ